MAHQARCSHGESMNRIFRVAAPIMVLGAGIGAYATLHATKPPPEETDEPPRVHSVFVEPVRTIDARLDVSTQGEVRPRTEVDIVAQVAGRVVAVSPEFTEGGPSRQAQRWSRSRTPITDSPLAKHVPRSQTRSWASSRPTRPLTSRADSSATSRTRRRSRSTSPRSPRPRRAWTPPAIASRRLSSIWSARASRFPSTVA